MGYSEYGISPVITIDFSRTSLQPSNGGTADPASVETVLNV
jgi:hypothetical protein